MKFLENISEKSDLEIAEDFGVLLSKRVYQQKQENEIVRGKVIGIRDGVVIVDVGLKSEGRIPLSEFNIDGQEREVKIGDEVDVFIEKLEGRSGMIVLSREKALRDEIWKHFETIYAQDDNVEGVIIGKVKGGLAVELGGLVAFLPGSQIDIRPIKDISSLLNIRQPFKILKMDKEHGNVVISRRAILEDSRKRDKEELLKNIVKGMVIEGVVKNITNYGAFIDMGVVDGLLHIADISWNRITHPSEVLKLNQKIKVIVIEYSPENQRISLGLKQLEPNPWEEIKAQYTIGTKHKGSVIAITDYGVFVSLAPNVDGLVHQTEIHWTAKNVHPSKLLHKGDEVEVMILDIDIAKHRMSLSIKRCQANVLEYFAQANPVGSKIEAVVTGVADFGLFVVRKEDIEQDYPIHILIPASEIAWDKHDGVLSRYNKGDVVMCIITDVDLEKERIVGSIKQGLSDPLVELADKLLDTEAVTATVAKVHKEGIELEIADGVVVFVDKTDLSKHKEEQKPSNFAIGDRMDVKILEFDKFKRQFKVSIKALQIEQDQKTIAEFGSINSGASLGDILSIKAVNKGSKEE
jgi:small subunit ribosomal protein S1